MLQNNRARLHLDIIYKTSIFKLEIYLNCCNRFHNFLIFKKVNNIKYLGATSF